MSGPDDWASPIGERALTAPEFIDEQIPDEPSYWGPHLVTGGGYTIVGGDSGVGKSVLCRTLLLHLAAGHKEFLGLTLPGRSIPSLCISGEGGRAAFRERMVSGATALGLDLRELPIYFLPRTIAPSGFKDVLPYLQESRVVLFDPMSKFFLGNENSTPEWREKFVAPVDAMRAKYGLAPIFTDHFSKPNEMRSGQHKLRGSAAKIQDAGAVMRLEYGKAGGAGRVLLIDRVRDDEKPEPDRLALTIDLKHGIIELDAQGDTETAPEIPNPRNDAREQRKAEQARDSVLDAMKEIDALNGGGPHSEREIALKAGLGRSREGFKAALRGLQVSGYIKPSGGGWELA